MVEELVGHEVEPAFFADHHDFTAEDVDALEAGAGGRTVVVTEKDAVKLMAFSSRLPGARVLALGVRFETGEELIRELLLGNGDDEVKP